MITRHRYRLSISFCVKRGLNPVRVYSSDFNTHRGAGVTGCWNKNSSLHAEDATQTFANVIFPVTKFAAAICVTTNNPWVWMIDKL